MEINLYQCHFCPPLLPHGLARDRTFDKAKAIDEGLTGINGVVVVLFAHFRGEPV
jgi:hypothetical protein